MKPKMSTIERILFDRFGRNNPLVGAEIGVNVGKTAKYLLGVFPGLFLWMIDHWSKTEGTTYWRHSANSRYRRAIRRTQHVRERREILRMFSSEAERMFEDGSLHFVYIDAAHWYDDVKEDIRLWWPKVKVGGILTGHDFSVDGEEKPVARAVREFVHDGSKVLSVCRGKESIETWSIPKDV